MGKTRDIIDDIINSTYVDLDDLETIKLKPKEVKRAFVKYLSDFNKKKKRYLRNNYNRKKYLFPIMFSAENKITEVFPILLEIFSFNTSDLYNLYDEIVSDIGTILYNTFDGDYKGLEKFIDNSEIDEAARIEALECFFRLVSEKKIHKTVYNNYVKKKMLLLDSEKEFDHMFLTHMAVYMCEFHMHSNLDLVRKIANSDAFIESVCGEYEAYVDKMFTYTDTTYINTISDRYSFVESAYKSKLYEFPVAPQLQDKEVSQKDIKKRQMIDNFINESTLIKPVDLGKNDLCFCESGLKYKKCCMGKKDKVYVYKRLENYYDLLIDYPQVENITKAKCGLKAYFSDESIQCDKLLYKALHLVRIPTYLPKDIKDERSIKLGYLLEAIDIAYRIIESNNITSSEVFDSKYMIHYNIFDVLNYTYKLIYDEHYPFPELYERIKKSLLLINRYLKNNE